MWHVSHFGSFFHYDSDNGKQWQQQRLQQSGVAAMVMEAMTMMANDGGDNGNDGNNDGSDSDDEKQW